MNFIKQIERIKKMHLLISTEKTGSPDAFARKLQLSRRQLYNELEIIKNLDATIKYSKKRESFYYGETDCSDMQNSPCVDSADLQSVPTPMGFTTNCTFPKN